MENHHLLDHPLRATGAKIQGSSILSEICFFCANNTLLVIVATDLHGEQVNAFVVVLQQFRIVIKWTIAGIISIPLGVCTYKIQSIKDYNSSIENQRCLNPTIQEVMCKEIMKWLDAGVIYPIPYSEWVSSVQCVPKKRGIIMVPNASKELIPL